MPTTTTAKPPEVSVETVTFTSQLNTSEASKLDPMLLSRLDTGLLRCLRKLGTPRQRICSALCISYAEYDDIVELLEDDQ
ncbi:MAG: hypothetical protein AAGF35_04820 [Pseudomonadota bacterium]